MSTCRLPAALISLIDGCSRAVVLVNMAIIVEVKVHRIGIAASSSARQAAFRSQGKIGRHWKADPLVWVKTAMGGLDVHSLLEDSFCQSHHHQQELSKSEE